MNKYYTNKAEHANAADTELLYANIPYEWKVQEQWVLHKGKEPYDTKTRRRRASHSDPGTWSPFAKALAVYERNPDDFDGIGFVFSDEDPYAGIDIDHCRDPKTGAIAEWALDILKGFEGAYVEVSLSGTGLHIICKGHAPNRKNQKAGVEAYSSKRFFTITGNIVRTAAEELPNCQDAIDALAAKYFPPEQIGNAKLKTPTEPVDLDDHELLERARKSRTGGLFAKLYDRGDTSGYASHSEADYALINALIFWTGGDGDRVETLFETSALYREGKGRSYVSRSVRKALMSYDGSFYRPRAVKSKPVEEQRDVLTPYLALLLDPACWTGRRAPGAYKAYAAMVVMAAEQGISTDAEELHVDSDVRTIAERSGMRRQSLCASSLPYLVEKKLVTWRRGKAGKAGTFILKPPPENSRNRTIKVSTQYFNGAVWGNGLHVLSRLIRMRSGSSQTGRIKGLGEMQRVARLGMVAMFCMVVLTTAPRGLTLEELAQRMGRDKYRVRDAMAKLVAAKIAAEPKEGFYALEEGLWTAYERELQRSLIVKAEQRQRKRHEKERREQEHKLKLGRAKWEAKRNPKVVEMAAERRRKLDKQARLSQPSDERYLSEWQRRRLEEERAQEAYERMVEERMARLGEELGGGA